MNSLISRVSVCQFAAAALLATAMPARADVTYPLNNYPDQQQGGTLSGSITVVDTAAADGRLQAGEIVRWTFTLTQGSNTLTVDSATTPAELYVAGTILIDASTIRIPQGGSSYLTLIWLGNTDIPNATLQWRRGVNGFDYYAAWSEFGTFEAEDDVTYWSTFAAPFALGGTDPWLIAGAPPPATGACCNPATGGCVVVLQADCATLGGIYAGDDITCAAAGCTAAPSCPASFGAPTFSTAGTNPLGAASADFNGDGFADAVTANEGSDSISVLLGNGNGTLRAGVQYPTGAAPRRLVIADFNADARPDIAVACFSGGADVLLNSGNGTFAPAFNVGFGGQNTSIAAGDLNGDGRPDLVVTRGPFNIFDIILATGSGTFAPRVEVNMPAGAAPEAVILADLNADGALDIIIGSTINGGSLSVYRGNGNGTFAAPQTVAAGGIPFSLAAADFNADGRIDVVGTVNNNAALFLSNPDGTLQAPTNFPMGVSPGAITSGDVNGDGAPDIAAVNFFDGTVTVRRGTRSGINAFDAPASYPAGDRPAGLATGDFNTDGRPDFVTANFGGNNVAVLLNTGPSIGFSTQPQSQTVPTGGTATFTVGVTGTGPFTYQWRRNGVPIPGARAATLSVTSVNPSKFGAYDVLVSGGCNPTAVATSRPAILGPNPSCLPDLNGDGIVNTADLVRFLGGFGQVCPPQ